MILNKFNKEVLLAFTQDNYFLSNIMGNLQIVPWIFLLSKMKTKVLRIKLNHFRLYQVDSATFRIETRLKLNFKSQIRSR